MPTFSLKPQKSNIFFIFLNSAQLKIWKTYEGSCIHDSKELGVATEQSLLVQNLETHFKKMFLIKQL